MSEDQHIVEVPPAKKQKLDDSNKVQAETSAESTENVTVSLENTEDVPVGDQVYGNLVSHEEFEKLREFKVLDEVKSNDEDSNDEDSDDSDGSGILEYLFLA